MDFGELGFDLAAASVRRSTQVPRFLREHFLAFKQAAARTASECGENAPMYPRVIRQLSRGCIAIPAIAFAVWRLKLRLLAAILRERLSNVVLLVRKVALLVAA